MLNSLLLSSSYFCFVKNTPIITEISVDFTYPKNIWKVNIVISHFTSFDVLLPWQAGDYYPSNFADTFVARSGTNLHSRKTTINPGMKPAITITVALFAKGLLPINFGPVDPVTVTTSVGVAVVGVPLLWVVDLFDFTKSK